MAERFAKKDSSTTSGIRSASGNLTAEHEARTKELQKGTGLGHKVRWFVGDKSTMAALAKEVDGNVLRLTRLFPGVVGPRQIMLAENELDNEVPSGSNNVMRKLAELRDRSDNIDVFKEQVAAEDIKQGGKRHTFRKTKVGQGALAQIGDAYGSGVEGRLEGAGHLYDRIEVDGANTIVTLGDRVNMPDIFAQSSGKQDRG